MEDFPLYEASEETPEPGGREDFDAVEELADKRGISLEMAERALNGGRVEAPAAKKQPARARRPVPKKAHAEASGRDLTNRETQKLGLPTAEDAASAKKGAAAARAALLASRSRRPE